MIYGSHTVVTYCNTFPNAMLTGPSDMDIDTKICKGLDDFDVVTSDRHKGAQEEGGIGNLNLGLHSLNLEAERFGFMIHYTNC